MKPRVDILPLLLLSCVQVPVLIIYIWWILSRTLYYLRPNCIESVYISSCVCKTIKHKFNHIIMLHLFIGSGVTVYWSVQMSRRSSWSYDCKNNIILMSFQYPSHLVKKFYLPIFVSKVIRLVVENYRCWHSLK